MVKLSPKQEKIVCYDGEKPLSVEAGPGAGKTRVIIERVKYLLNEKKVAPESMLIITFTRKAADELKDRLSKDDIAKSDIDLMQISTIHGFCSRILQESGAIGFDVIDDDLNEKNNMFISRHLEDLGFKDEFTVKPKDVRDIVRKYNEYTTFNVDTKCLTEYIKEVRPISVEYLTFVKNYMQENDGKFPFDEVYEDKEVLNKSYYNAKYLKIAESYPKYLQLLEDENLTDFSLMQVNTLKYLELNPETPFTNVLIDEFQDTDPVQMKIFSILMDNADSFMVVGDVEQSIYGFRGSIENYFKKLYDEHGDKVEQMDLSTNYRSTNEIIDFSEKYIYNQKIKHSSKSDADGDRNVSRDIYYMVSDDNESEADQLVSLILNLKHTNKIDNYSEIGVLVRSVTNKHNCVNPLIEKLKENDIPYQVKGRNDLLERDEIKSILTLIYYIIQDDDEHNPIFNGWELDWLNLKAFTDENFKQTLVNLSDETKDILNSVQDKFEADVIATEKDVWFEMTGKKSKKSTFSGVLKREDDIKVEIFKRISRPLITLDNLRKWGVTNKDDLTFFYLLEQIKNKYFDEDIDWKEKPSILDLFLELLTITDCWDEEFINSDENKHHVENLALLSNTLFNYEQVRNPKDLAGAFWFIYHNIDEYGAYAEGEGVQIMTVHKSKGLEFPVVIVGSLSEGKFPMKFKDPNPPSGYAFIGGKNRPVYYSPNHCLEYKPFGKTLDENGVLIDEKVHEEMAHNEEEERIVYVAITRAKDTLILSNISENSEDLLDKAFKQANDDGLDDKTKKQYFNLVPKGNKKVQHIIDANDYCKPLRNNFEIIEPTVCKKDDVKGEPIKLSFTSLMNYQQCPLKYRLANDFGLKTTDTRRMSDGIFVHKVFEVINKLIKENDNVYIGDERVKSTLTNLFYKTKLEETPNEDNSQKLARITDDVLYYYHNFGKDLKIIDCEVPFYIKKENYSLNGVIDLLYETKDGKVGILDYKNTKSTDKYLQKYIKQLYMYIIGLSDENHKYAGSEITELNIYEIMSKEAKHIPINQAEIDELAQDIETTAQNIGECNFSSAKDSNCDDCPYAMICKGKPTNVVLPPMSQGSDAKFCHQCGNKLDAGMKFCPECGQKL